MNMLIDRLGLQPGSQPLLGEMPFRMGLGAASARRPHLRTDRSPAAAARTAARYSAPTNRLELVLFVSTLTLVGWQSLETLAAVLRAIGA
jgi:hypothetical protein